MSYQFPGSNKPSVNDRIPHRLQTIHTGLGIRQALSLNFATRQPLNNTATQVNTILRMIFLVNVSGWRGAIKASQS